ncbi:helix-turn-helix domain-containing protein [Curvivirga sp.]|uniref:helix-turn-helix domain-containing protein n=1 Tax=Curvivirga sp. TaxID=2856848 RepID=UPI003B5BD072
MILSSGHLNKYTSKGDLWKKFPTFSVSPPISEPENLLRGNIDFINLQEGLSVHFSDACDVRDVKIMRECQPRLCISFFLEGNIEAYIGDDPIPMPIFDEDKQSWKPIASVFSQRKMEIFKRYAKRGSYIKKIVISLSPSWLEKFSQSSSEIQKIRDFTSKHLARKNWIPSSHAISMVEQIVASDNIPDVLRSLYIESRVIMLVEEAFRELISDGTQDCPAGLRPQDRDRLKKIDQYLRDQACHQISTNELASKVGISINSLQRLLSKVYGMSASKYIRTFMLERARTTMERDGISIAEAAYLAGYNSPANFATAFKKCFGFSPGRLSEF